MLLDTNEGQIKRFCGDFGYSIAAIQRDLYDRGEPTGVVDVLIAATALARDEGVLTRTVDEFARVEDLDVETY